MRAHLLLAASLLIAPAAALQGQAPADASGHWEGSIQVGPNTAIRVEVDLGRNGKGEMAGTFSQPDQNVKGLPLATVAADGRSVRFVVKGGGAPANFAATLAGDGKALTGEVEQGGATVPFTLTRAGDARFAPAPKSAAIAQELEGTWNGAIELGGREERLVLKMTNQPDGTAAATILDRDGSNIEIPVAIEQKSANITIDIASVGGRYDGVVNANHEIVGTWTQGTTSLPLTFKQAGK